MVGVVNEDILIKQGNKKIKEKQQRIVDNKKNGAKMDQNNINSLIDEISPETKSTLDKALKCMAINDDDEQETNDAPVVSNVSTEDIAIKSEKFDEEIREEIKDGYN